MAIKKPRKWRPTYLKHTEEETRISFRGLNAVSVDYLQEITLFEVSGPTEFDRGVAEGERRLAGRLVGWALDYDDEKIEVKKSTRR